MQQKHRTTRWITRGFAALLMAALAWWVVHEWIRPIPLFRLWINDRQQLTSTLSAGETTFIEVHHRLDNSHFESSVASFDHGRCIFLPRDDRFSISTMLNSPFRGSKVLQNRYLLTPESSHAFDMVDSITGKKTHHVFSESSTLFYGFRGNTVLEARTLPVAPFSALSPTPWSAIPAALLMSADAQRLYGYAIGPVLIQVRSLPEFKVVHEYALPASAPLRKIWLSDGGKTLMHVSTCFMYKWDILANLAVPYFDRFAPSTVSKSMRGWYRLSNFSERGFGSPERWMMEISQRLGKPALLPSQAVIIDLSDLWPDFATSCEVYDAETGKLRYTLDFNQQNQRRRGYLQFCVEDWARLQVLPDMSTADTEATKLVVHLPTGRTFTEDQWPAAGDPRFKKYGIVPDGTPGVAMVNAQQGVSATPDGQIQGTVLLRRLFSDGSSQPLGEYPFVFNGMVHLMGTNQILRSSSWRLALPDWLGKLAGRWPWLESKLNATNMSIVDVDTGLTLWTYRLAPPRAGRSEAPRHFGRDQLLAIPTEREGAWLLYEFYSTPFSPWLPLWCPLAAMVTLLLVLSQGWQRFRFRRPQA